MTKVGLRTMEPPVKPLFDWPGFGALAYAYGILGPLLLGWFVLVYGGTDYMTGLHDFRVRLHLQAELDIPFVPSMVLFYNSLHLVYLIGPFVMRTRPELQAMASTLALITLFGGVVFLLVPSQVVHASPSESALGFWRLMYQFADRANLEFNMCPSLHVAWAIACIDVYSRSIRRTASWCLWTWGIGITLSTILLHQHYVVDAVAGLLLAIAGSRFLYPRLADRFLLGSF